MVIGIGNNEIRAKWFEKLVALGCKPLTIISSAAHVSPRAVILAGSAVQAGAVIGHNVIVNIDSVVDHDAVVGDHAHLGPNSTVGSFGPELKSREAVRALHADGGVRLRRTLIFFPPTIPRQY